MQLTALRVAADTERWAGRREMERRAGPRQAQAGR